MTTKISAANVKLKRAYEPPAADDGTRILVDRLWPRGVTKKRAAIDQWMKDIAPSTELRKWFSHDPARWDEFRRRYAQEVHKTAIFSINCAPLRDTAPSRWCTQRMTRSTTMPSN